MLPRLLGAPFGSLLSDVSSPLAERSDRSGGTRGGTGDSPCRQGPKRCSRTCRVHWQRAARGEEASRRTRSRAVGVFFGMALGRVESVGRETSSENSQPARLGDSARCGSLTIWSRTRAVSPREPARNGSLGSFGERGPLLSGTWSDAFLYLLRLRTRGRWPGEGSARTDRETAEDPSPQAIPSPHGSAGWVRLVARRDAARRSAVRASRFHHPGIPQKPNNLPSVKEPKRTSDGFHTGVFIGARTGRPEIRYRKAPENRGDPARNPGSGSRAGS